MQHGTSSTGGPKFETAPATELRADGAEPVTVNVTVVQPAKSWMSPDLYAPAFPGVAVALMTLYIAHRLTQRRDRRKEVHELCVALKKTATDANDAAVKGWLAIVSDTRLLDVEDAKRKIQSLGIAATDLKTRTHRRRYPYWRSPTDIDAIVEVSRLRSAATSDPFEDPERPPDTSRLRDISQAVSELSVCIDRSFAALYP